jgi:hypothetical protein
MLTDIAEEVRERADECRREAARATNAADVVAWLSLADEWRQLEQANDIDCATIAVAHAAEGRTPFALI